MQGARMLFIISQRWTTFPGHFTLAFSQCAFCCGKERENARLDSAMIARLIWQLAACLTHSMAKPVAVSTVESVSNPETPVDHDSAPRQQPLGDDESGSVQPVQPKPHTSRFRGLEGITEEERRRPPADDPSLVELEHQAAKALPDQLPLFGQTSDGTFTANVGGIQPLQPSSSLDLARTWYRRELELSRRPRNTIESYSWDLQVFENLIGPKPLNKIDRRDIARLLGEANNRTTRKRRLTSVRGFFRYLIEDARVLRIDPTEGYYPHAIQLRSPLPLFADEQDALLAAALTDESWSATAIWLMMRLGLTRSELLALRRDHIDRSSPAMPVVFVFYDNVSKQSKERKLAANGEFATLYDRFLDDRDPEDILFPVGPQAVNGMVERVRRIAEISKDVSPQTLRHTFAIEQARTGSDRTQLLDLLGLADDPRNRASVDRYIRFASEPLGAADDAAGRAGEIQIDSPG